MTINIKKLFNSFLAQPKGDYLKNSLIRGTSGAFLINVLSAGIAFGVQVLLAQLLGPNVYGDYIYVINWVLLFTLLGKIGLDTASLRYISEYYAQGRWELLVGFLKRSYQIVIIISVSLAVIMSGAILVLWDSFGDDLGFLFLLSALLLPFNSLLEVGGSNLRGLKYVITAIAPRAILHPLLLAFGAIVAFWVVGLEPSASITMIINIIGTLITLSVIFYYLFKALPSSAIKAEPKYLTKEWLKVALPLFLISGIHLLLIRTDVLMIGIISGTTEAGIYSAASRVTEIMLFGQNSVMFIFAPMISEIYSKKDKVELQRMVTLATRGILVISLPVGISLILMGKFILSLFGPMFTVGYSALLVLILGQLILAFFGTAGWLLSMTGHQRENAIIVGLGLILNVSLNTLLIPYWGLFGAAVATTISTMASNILLAYFVWKRLNIIPFSGLFKL